MTARKRSIRRTTRQQGCFSGMTARELLATPVLVDGVQYHEVHIATARAGYTVTLYCDRKGPVLGWAPPRGMRVLFEDARMHVPETEHAHRELIEGLLEAAREGRLGRLEDQSWGLSVLV